MIFTNTSKLDSMFKNMLDDFNYFYESPSRFKNLPSIVKDEQGIEFKLTIPGYERENLEISITDDILRIETLDKTLDEDQLEFKREFTIMEDIDKLTCTSSMKAGILKINFKYKEEELPKRIIIK